MLKKMHDSTPKPFSENLLDDDTVSYTVFPRSDAILSCSGYLR